MPFGRDAHGFAVAMPDVAHLLGSTSVSFPQRARRGHGGGIRRNYVIGDAEANVASYQAAICARDEKPSLPRMRCT